MPQDPTAASSGASQKRRGVARRRREFPFDYDLSQVDGLVIHPVAGKVSKRDWADLEFFLRCCNFCTRGRLKMTVQLRARSS